MVMRSPEERRPPPRRLPPARERRAAPGIGEDAGRPIPSHAWLVAWQSGVEWLVLVSTDVDAAVLCSSLNRAYRDRFVLARVDRGAFAVGSVAAAAQPARRLPEDTAPTVLSTPLRSTPVRVWGIGRPDGSRWVAIGELAADRARVAAAVAPEAPVIRPGPLGAFLVEGRPALPGFVPVEAPGGWLDRDARLWRQWPGVELGLRGPGPEAKSRSRGNHSPAGALFDVP
jgi:hypothetical protein